MNSKKIFLLAIVCIFFSANAFAEITVTSVKGQAKYKTGKQWANITQGMKLAVGTKVSTGARSSITLNVNDSTVVIRQMSMLKIEENSLNAEESKTTIGLRRGGLNARVSKIKELKTTFKVTTPVATSSVRGTEEEISYGPGRGMIIKVLEGIIEAENRLGAINQVRGNLEYRQGSRSSGPDDMNSARRELARGGLINLLTPEERLYLENYSDMIITSDDSSSFIFTISGGGAGNVTVTPVFP